MRSSISPIKPRIGPRTSASSGGDGRVRVERRGEVRMVDAVRREVRLRVVAALRLDEPPRGREDEVRAAAELALQRLERQAVDPRELRASCRCSSRRASDCPRSAYSATFGGRSRAGTAPMPSRRRRRPTVARSSGG